MNQNEEKNKKQSFTKKAMNIANKGIETVVQGVNTAVGFANKKKTEIEEKVEEKKFQQAIDNVFNESSTKYLLEKFSQTKNKILTHTIYAKTVNQKIIYRQTEPIGYGDCLINEKTKVPYAIKNIENTPFNFEVDLNGKKGNIICLQATIDLLETKNNQSPSELEIHMNELENLVKSKKDKKLANAFLEFKTMIDGKFKDQTILDKLIKLEKHDTNFIILVTKIYNSN